MPRNNIKKKDLIKNLSNLTGFSLLFSKKIINDIIEIIIKNIKSGDFNLKNIGSFKTTKKNERIGRNPKTKETHIITSRKVVRFVLSENISKHLKVYE